MLMLHVNVSYQSNHAVMKEREFGESRPHLIQITGRD